MKSQFGRERGQVFPWTRNFWPFSVFLLGSFSWLMGSDVSMTDHKLASLLCLSVQKGSCRWGWVRPAAHPIGCAAPAMHLTDTISTLTTKGPEPSRDTGTYVSHGSTKKGKNVIFRNCKWSISFPPGFCNHVLLIFLNIHLCPISVCEAYTDNVGSQAMDTKALARLQSEQTKREKCAIGDFVMCSKMKWLAQWKMLLWLI